MSLTGIRTTVPDSITNKIGQPCQRVFMIPAVIVLTLDDPRAAVHSFW